MQSPGAAALTDTSGATEARLRTYVTGVVGRFKDDARILGWVRVSILTCDSNPKRSRPPNRKIVRDRRDPRCQDVWNEPDNPNGGSYSSKEPGNKVDRVAYYLPKVFQWAREADASQPLTSGIWAYNLGRLKCAPRQPSRLRRRERCRPWPPLRCQSSAETGAAPAPRPPPQARREHPALAIGHYLVPLLLQRHLRRRQARASPSK